MRRTLPPCEDRDEQWRRTATRYRRQTSARLFIFAPGRAGPQPLRLTAVPRDHVVGDRGRGDAMLAGRFIVGDEMVALSDLDFAELGAIGPLAETLQGFSWLRDLAASAGRERGARVAEALTGRWLVAHGTRIDEAWRPALWGERILFWTAYAPYILSSRDQGYRSAVLNTLARGARHLDASADKGDARPRPDHGMGRCCRRRACLAGGLPRIARAEAGLMRALATAQFEDGGLMSRSPNEQYLLVIDLAYFVPPISQLSRNSPKVWKMRPPQHLPRFMVSRWATALCPVGKAAIPVIRREWRL